MRRQIAAKTGYYIRRRHRTYNPSLNELREALAERNRESRATIRRSRWLIPWPNSLLPRGQSTFDLSRLRLSHVELRVAIIFPHLDSS